MTSDLQVRFWAKVERRGPNECWPWIGAHDQRGYGSVHVDGRRRRATQVAWEIENGRSFPAGAHACHTCDNPPCVNPAHIWPGTTKENLTDASDKGRLFNSKKTLCVRGHDLALAEVRPGKKNGRPERVCLECERLRVERHKISRRKPPIPEGERPAFKYSARGPHPATCKNGHDRLGRRDCNQCRSERRFARIARSALSANKE